MRSFIYGLSILAVVAFVTAAMAADNAPAAAASAPTASQSGHCGNTKRHDHAAERGAARAKSADCPAMAASAIKPLHDHRAVHK
jgi:hypothetical protein